MSSGSVVTFSGWRMGRRGIVRPFHLTPFRKNSFHTQSAGLPLAAKKGPRIVSSSESWNSAIRNRNEVSIAAE